MHLTLFFTRGNSLDQWHSSGSLEREILLYKALQRRGMQISFVTYGTSGEEQFTQSIPGIEILYNRWNLPLPVYEILIPWLHSKSLRKSDLFKTNQLKGAHTALIAGRMWKKPVIVRVGYLWSKFLSRERGSMSKAHLACYYENLNLKRADKIIVTTQEIRKELLHRLPGIEGKIIIIPNYVDTNLFSPDPGRLSSRRLIFVGRFSAQKNLSSLIEAIAPLDTELEIIGTGELEQKLKNQASASGANVTFSGAIPNEKLPISLNRAAVFVLPSLYEGHPKALLEAMSCGLAVIGTDVDGIRELICHGEIGWLCQPDVASIRTAIIHLLEYPEIREDLGRNARKYVVKHFSIDQIANQEFELYQRL